MNEPVRESDISSSVSPVDCDSTAPTSRFMPPMLVYTTRVFSALAKTTAARVFRRGSRSPFRLDLARATTRVTLMSTLDLGIPWARRLGGLATGRFRPPKDVSVHRQDRDGFVWLEVRPDGWSADQGTLIYFHGGGFVLGSPDAALPHLAHVALATGWRIAAPQYPLAPEASLTSIRDHASEVTKLIVEQDQAHTLLLGGDSAGAALALWTHSADGIVGVDGLVLLSPWVAPGAFGGSIETNASEDVADRSFLEFCRRQAFPGDAEPGLVAGLVDDSAALSGLPVLITIGEDEMLLDQALDLEAGLEAKGTEVTLRRYDGSPHTFWAFRGIDPNAERLVDDVAAWWSGRPKGTPR